jgi:hypothetical protein
VKRTIFASFLCLSSFILPPLASAQLSIEHSLPDAAIGDLPAPERIPVGRGIHMLIGTFDGAADWEAFQRDAGIRGPRVNFRRERVAYVVLDLQSHFMNPVDVRVDGDRARVRVRHYAGSIARVGTVPSVFVAVPRRGVRYIDFVYEDGSPLGTLEVR